MIRIPYGVSDFKDMPTENYYYLDRTHYIERLEKRGEKTVLFIRPRRFGKSLFVSMLHYYYGLEYKADFDTFFGKYYIGQKPTPLANQYLVFLIDFSGIDTSSPENTYRDFVEKVKTSALKFLAKYSQFFNEKDAQIIEKQTTPQGLLNRFLTLVEIKAPQQQLFVLIDEYDHFTNELLSFHFEHFKKIVSKNGWVRKFYEVLKTGTTHGPVDRIFITGISPITLDNLTTGFNIASNFGIEAFLNEMMGFTEKEVIGILKEIGVPKNNLENVVNNLRFWYDGYLFHQNGSQKVYNPDMVFYFAKYYAEYQEYPMDLMDENIISDYGKMRQMFRINDSKQENYKSLKEIVENGYIKSDLTKQYSFERSWTRADFISLLFYMGILSIKPKKSSRPIFVIPNYVIQQLYFQYFHQLTLENSKLKPEQLNLIDKVEDLADHNELQPLLDLLQNILSELGQEDKAHFNETSLKTLFASFFYQVRIFNIFSELEVQKAKGEKGRVDLLLMRRPPFETNFQFVFELKYIRQKQKSTFDKIKKGAIHQMKQYLQHDDTLKQLDNLKAYCIIFVGNKGQAFPVFK